MFDSRTKDLFSNLASPLQTTNLSMLLMLYGLEWRSMKNYFLPGDCLRVDHPDGLVQVIMTLQDGSKEVVLFWPQYSISSSMELLLACHFHWREEATIKKPWSLALLVFICNVDSIEIYSSWYVYGIILWIVYHLNCREFSPLGGRVNQFTLLHMFQSLGTWVQ